MIRTGRILVATSAIALLGATGAAIAQNPARTVQQDFEAAAALDAGTDRLAALAAWQALEARTAKNRRSHAIVLVRKSAVLMRLDRRDEAIRAARAGLADLPTTDATLRADRMSAYLVIGRVAEATLDYAGAAESYRQADALADAPVDKVATGLGLVRVETFTDPAAATADLARVDAVLTKVKADPTVQGEIEMRRAVLALNQGQIPEAQRYSKAAVADLGGLTDRIDLRDVSARSTAAIAALLAGQKDNARRYMAMTGAGRIDGGGLMRGTQMRVPDCQGDNDLKPQDFAVVEFSIADDGTVSDVAPVYAQGGGEVALTFARVAQDWSWTPEQVAKLPRFYRYNARVELRCSTGFERPSLDKLLRDETAAWLQANGARLPDEREGVDAASVDAERAALAAADASDPRGLAAFVALYQLDSNSVVGREEKHDFSQRALDIAIARQAPPIVRVALQNTVLATAQADPSRGEWRRALTALVADPAYAGDPMARATLRLQLVDQQRDDDAKLVLLRQVADDGGLKPNDPLKVNALIRIASLEQRQGNADAARTAYLRSGLAPNQCAIIDSPPQRVSGGGTFPQEAQVWGFEGWTRVQFDVAADGRVVNQRAIVSYPPFIFSNASTDIVKNARYTKTYRPDGGLGCGAQTTGVVFTM